MALTPGTRLGPYEIAALLGVGGMGEVYRATDTTLGREVAIKVLPDAFANDPERLARFEREAKTLASLNHPHIAAIYGFERAPSTGSGQAGIGALVMELVEGPTLADRIAQGPIAVDDALPIAKQIADALEAAHEQGIVHRDLKPANIKVKDDGTVKVLDFGLAKALAPEAMGGAGVLANSPTITSPAMTQRGVILGTAAYMSPEQARGKAVDTRTDIWAFGCVLFEMLTGKRAFEAEDVSLTLAEVMKSDPKWSLLPPLPTPVEMFLRQCLKKDRRQRVQAIGDVRLALEGAFETTAARPATPVRPLPRRRTLALAAAALLGIGGAAGTGVALWTVPPPPVPVGRFTLMRPEKTRLGYHEAAGRAALSPDGRTVAFTAVASTGVRQIWVRPLDSLVSKPLAGTEGGAFPFWSPDSRQLGFFANGKLKKIESQGGTPLTLCDLITNTSRGGTWSPAGIILFALSGGNPLYQVSAGGGAPTPATVLDPEHGVTTHRFPWFLPDGRHFLFFATAVQSSAQPVGGIQLGSLDARDVRTLVPAGTNKEPLSSAVYAQGYLLFSRQNTLLAQPFEETTLNTTGDIAPVVEQVASIPAVGEGAFSVSSTGLLLFLAGGDSTRQRLAWVDRAGKHLATLGDPVHGIIATGISAAISADGRYVAASFQADVRGNRDIRIYDLRTNLGRTIVSSPSNDDFPVWSPDGKTIAHQRVPGGLHTTTTDSAGTEATLSSDPTDTYPTTWSPDGKFLLFSPTAGAARGDILALPMTGERKRWPVIQTPADESDARLAPDGRWLVYTSNQSGRTEVYAAAFTGTPGAQTSASRQVSIDGGTSPRWRADGREILYLTPDRMLMAADAKLGNGSLDVGTPRPLFGPLSYTAYDVSPDGQRFLVTMPVGDVVEQPLTIIQNWTATLRK